jgi:hypothetical protein
MRIITPATMATATNTNCSFGDIRGIWEWSAPTSTHGFAQEFTGMVLKRFSEWAISRPVSFVAGGVDADGN